MRLIANIDQSDDEVKRLMIHDSEEGVFLFGYDSIMDSSSLWDQWFEKIEIALEYCKEAFGVIDADWQEIPDPPEGCQQDWIDPVRVKGRDIGNPELGKLEKLVDGKWKEFKRE